MFKTLLVHVLIVLFKVISCLFKEMQSFVENSNLGWLPPPFLQMD